MKFLLILFTIVVATSASTFNGSSKGSTTGGEDPDPAVQFKRNFVRRMLLDAWANYERYAWGENQLKPVSLRGEDGGIFGDSQIGATIIDALGTLHIMGLSDEYRKASDWIKNNLDFPSLDATVSVFETNIRLLGGLLSAYSMTKEEHLKDIAYELGKLLLPAFDTPTGLPRGRINIKTGEASGDVITLVDFGTLQLEFTYLSQVTGDNIFIEKLDKIKQLTKQLAREDGLYSNFIDVNSGQFTGDDISMGVFADSFYEYLLKLDLMVGDSESRNLYNDVIEAFVRNGLVKKSKQNNLLYFAEMHNGVIDDMAWHFACFAGGMLALGAKTDPSNPNSDRDAEMGREFTNTCHESYSRSSTGLGPEIFRFTDNDEAIGTDDWARGYYLRPEVIESYFYLYRLTGDNKYRDWGWEAAVGISVYCQVGPLGGFSGINNVYDTNPEKNDVQETFFFAETLKYLYLLFSTNDLIQLDEWVFNTEAHPLPITRGHN